MKSNGISKTNGKANGSVKCGHDGRVRCAIYTRKSTSEGLDSDFNTLDAQREACEFFIRSQVGDGWEVIETHYDDGGYTGGNIDRPAFQRLLTDIENGLVDQIVVYKVDRLSRSLMDFARIMGNLDAANIGFVSVTQQFNTASSMGRLTLNILLSFAQFEREIISERTRDKIGASRKKGKWTGGFVSLGYAVDRERKRLVIVPEEADVVRRVFGLYLSIGSLAVTAQRLNDLGYKTKARGGKNPHDGKSWHKQAVSKVLHNPLYLGKVHYEGVLYEGEHEAIIEKEMFDRVHTVLRDGAPSPQRTGRNPDFILTGLLTCGYCGAPFTSSGGTSHTGKHYRYYKCSRKAREGKKACRSSAVPAHKLEDFVVEKIWRVAGDKAIRNAIRKRLEDDRDNGSQHLVEQRERLAVRIREIEAEAKSVINAIGSIEGAGATLLTGRLGEIEMELERLGRAAQEIDGQLATLNSRLANTEKMLGILDVFDSVWDALIPAERRELVALLVKSITVDQESGVIGIDYHALGDESEEENTEPPYTEEAHP